MNTIYTQSGLVTIIDNGEKGVTIKLAAAKSRQTTAIVTIVDDSGDNVTLAWLPSPK